MVLPTDKTPPPVSFILSQRVVLGCETKFFELNFPAGFLGWFD